MNGRWMWFGIVAMAASCSSQERPQHSGYPSNPQGTPPPGYGQPPPGTPHGWPPPAPATAPPPATVAPPATAIVAPPATATAPPVPTAATTATATTADKPPASTEPPGGKPVGKAAGELCSRGKECQSGSCEGLGCGYNAGKCTEPNRACTRDLVAYCGCNNKTFGASSTCPGRTYRKKGECK